jgi:hypothetical protein
VAEVKEWNTQADLNVGDAPDWLSPFVAKYKDWNNFKREAQAAMARWYEQRDVGVDATTVSGSAYPELTANGNVPCKVSGVLDGTPELLLWVQSDINQVPNLRWRAPITVGGAAVDVVTRQIKYANGKAPIPETLKADGALRLVYNGSEFLALSPLVADTIEWNTPFGFSTTELDASRIERLNIVNAFEDIIATMPADADDWWPIGASMYVAIDRSARFRVQALTGLFFPGFTSPGEPIGAGFGGHAKLVALTRTSPLFVEFSPAYMMPIAGGP